MLKNYLSSSTPLSQMILGTQKCKLQTLEDGVIIIIKQIERCPT